MLDEMISKLCMPYSIQEPNLNDDELSQLDALADKVEILRAERPWSSFTYFHVAPRRGKEVDYKVCEDLKRQVHWRHQVQAPTIQIRCP